ncbi:hypothetical protein ACFXGA_34880, partial [Actinosynnema sp. NPDC059335]|uniref:hypothetical protein n=1 Tax=Actinosynnema sp. NPDC059335 TaxID=3346804 RepID=UPI00366DD58C
MSNEDPTPTAGVVNWEAYSHEELYRMLWQDADVADVSVVATEWARHREALDAHAEVLREQRAALPDGWQGQAAREAADRLGALADRVEKIGELAHAGHRAAQEAADALAAARAMMPPPPAGGGTTVPTPPALPALPTIPAPSALPPLPALPALPTAPTMSTSSFTAPFTSLPNFAAMVAPTPATTTSGVGTAFGAVGGAGFSFYFGAVSADQRKAEAVRAMRTYESSLVGGSRLIDGARGAIPPAAAPTTPATAPPMTSTGGPPTGGVSGGSPTGARTPVPWSRLLGGGASPVAVGSPGTPATGHAAPQPGPGLRAGVLPGAVG